MKWKLRRVAKKCFFKNSIGRTKYRLSRTFKNFFDKKFTNVLSNRLKCITKYVYHGNIIYIL